MFFKISILGAILAVSLSVNATMPDLLAGSEFAAPVVSDTSDVSNKQVGMIIFDASTNQFKGLNSSGNWDIMTVAGTSPVSSGGDERIERLRVAACSASPCTVASQSGSWVSGIVRNSTGNYTMTINTGVFSNVPSCVISSNTTTWCFGDITSATTYNFQCRSDAGANVDSGFHIICQGPR